MAQIKFGVRLNIQGEMGADSSAFAYTLEMARLAEDLGYDSIWIPDHVENAHLDRAKPILEHWTTLTALGALTSRVNLGGHSLNNNLRHPGLTAKIVCTLDRITNGRVILAPGSGWFAAEAQAYGMPWGDRRERHERLLESLEIMRRMFTEPVVNFDGKHFKISDAFCNPKPVQQPHPPFWIAGEGPLTQELVAQYADVWFMYSKPPDAVRALVEPMRERLDRPLKVALSAVCLTGRSAQETRRWAEMYADERKHRFDVPPTVEDVLASNLTGDADAMCARVDEWIDAGVDYLVIQPMPPMEGTRFFGEHVIARFA